MWTIAGAALLTVCTVGPAAPASAATAGRPAAAGPGAPAARPAVLAVPAQRAAVRSIPLGQRGRPYYRPVELGAVGSGGSGSRGFNDRGEVIGYQEIERGRTARALRWAAGRWTDLGSLGGGSSYPNDLNNRGDIVGSSQTRTGTYHAFLWRNGVMTDLGTLGGTESAAAAVNDAGEIVGASRNAAGRYHAFRWRNGVMTNLGTLGGAESYAADINNRGEVVGHLFTSSSARSFRWRNGVMSALGPLGGPYAFVTAINERGHVLGLCGNPDSPLNWCLWLDGGGVDTGLGYDGPATVNDLDQIATTRFNGSTWRAVRWQSGVTTELPLLAGDQPTLAFDINDRGQVVGLSGTYGDQVWAVLWDHDGQVTRLPLSGGSYSVAHRINNRSEILGVRTGLVEDHILWQPIRAPARHLPPPPSPQGNGSALG